MTPFARFPSRLLPVFLVATFLSALLWSSASDPLQRIQFSLRLADSPPTKGLVVLPKPISSRPVVIYLHDSAEGLQQSGLRLRQFAEVGLAAVDIAYDRRSQAIFDRQFKQLCDYLARQPWADSNSVAWFGYGSSVQRLLNFAASHPQIRPQLLMCLPGEPSSTSSNGQPREQATSPSSAGQKQEMSSPGFRCLLIGGTNDARQLAQSEIADAGPLARADKLAISIVPARAPDFGSDKAIVYRALAEYTATQFGLSAHRSTYSPGCFWCWIPAFLSGLYLLALAYHWLVAWLSMGIPPAARRFYVLCGFVALLALFQTSLRVCVPWLPISTGSIFVARRTLVSSQARPDFDFLAKDAAWTRKPLKQLLQHVELARLQRSQFYAKLDNTIFQNYLLSPRIKDGPVQEWGWRRPLWEAFSPRVRAETNALAGARLVVRFLRERVGINATDEREEGDGAETCWKLGMAGTSGFEELCIAALRSAGIAARLNAGRAELWTGNEWAPVPEPMLKFGVPPTLAVRIQTSN